MSHIQVYIWHMPIELLFVYYLHKPLVTRVIVIISSWIQRFNRLRSTLSDHHTTCQNHKFFQIKQSYDVGAIPFQSINIGTNFQRKQIFIILINKYLKQVN